MSSALLDDGRKALNAITLALFVLDGKAGAAFSDGQPHGAAHHELAAELPFESCHTLPHIEGERLGGLRGEIHLRAEARIPEQIVTHAPAGIVDGGRRGKFARGIEGCKVVTARAVRYIELPAGEAFIQKAGPTGVLSGGFGSDPPLEVSGRQHRSRWTPSCFRAKARWLATVESGLRSSYTALCSVRPSSTVARLPPMAVSTGKA